MTDQEFKRLSRAQLIDIIYQLQLQVDKLTEQKQTLERALVDKRLRIESAGNIAEAALEINDCFRNAQNAAEQYLNEIKILRETTEIESKKLYAKAKNELAAAQKEAARLVSEAQAEADEILRTTKRSQSDYNAAIDMILLEYGQDEEFTESDC